MTAPEPGVAGTAIETLPFTDGRVLTVVTDLATRKRSATLDGVPLEEGGDLVALTADGRSFRGGGGQPVIFDGVPVPEGEIDARVAEWQGNHAPLAPALDDVPDAGRQARVALMHARAFRGARPRG